MPITITVQRDKLSALIRQLPVKSQQQVDNAAGDIQGRASQLAPRDTGSLAASIYKTNGQESDYSSHAAQAHALNSTAVILAEVTPDLALSLSGSDSGGYKVVVGVAVEHGIFQEFGTRYQAPQPFLTPAVEGVRDLFIASMKTVADV